MATQQLRRPSYVEKQCISVVIHTRDHRIEGKMHVSYNHRATDALNSHEPFLPVTSVRVYDDKGLMVIEREFVAVNKHEIVLLYECTDRPYDEP